MCKVSVKEPTAESPAVGFGGELFSPLLNVEMDPGRHIEYATRVLEGTISSLFITASRNQ